MIIGNKKTVFTYIALYFLLWIILFEFILPVNNILPKPSIVLESFPALVTDYQLFGNYISTILVIYLSLLAAYFAVKLFILLPVKENRIVTDFIASLEWFSEYIPGIVLGLLLIFWFPASEYIEFIFAFLTAFFSMLIRTKKEETRIPEEYLTASRSLALTENSIRKNIYWKFYQSALLKRMKSLHFYLWLILIAFEYIKGGYGIGNIFHRALIYEDISAFFSAAILTGLTIYLASTIITYIQNRIIFWK
jgi:ABC-type nitrate/sulfonate/bicarbonate transport system permease component